MILDLGVFHYLSVLLCCEWVGFERFRQPTTLNRKKIRLELTRKLEGGGGEGGEGEGKGGCQDWRMLPNSVGI